MPLDSPNETPHKYFSIYVQELEEEEENEERFLFQFVNINGC
jgi:hypothetical protein